MPSTPSIDTLIGHDTHPRSATVIDCAVYVAGARLPGHWTPAEALDEVRRRGAGFVWIGLYEPDADQLDDLAETYRLHTMAVGDALNGSRRPKLDRYDDTLFTAFKTVGHVTQDSATTTKEIVETGEIMVFLGRDFIVTVRHRQHSGLRGLRTDLEATPARLALGPAAVLHAIADHVVNDYLAVTDAVEHDIDEVEALVFAPGTTIGAEQMYLIKREIVELRRAVTPLAKPLRALAETDAPLVPPQMRAHFHAVDDHLATVAERITGFDEILTTLLNATLAKVTLQQNNDMRKITAWAAMITVPTMVVGVYGMNFDQMPELRWKYGYPFVVAVILFACLVLHRTFKRNKWL
ncbi:magnesium and cobalt transport protein CorA [Actinokineospora sp.]|uniref:magnesium and cobalt transport protein CorA n=1 Tax=Actinokineospora sp. TaxID=1872133 RepID=UPI0040382BFF